MINLDKLKSTGLKVTPQRLAVIEAFVELKNHPTAEEIVGFIRQKHPNIGVGTVYHILEIFEEKKLIKKVKTENGTMRYDGLYEHHHHLYCEESNRIEDYIDDELDDLIIKYFKNKKIENFKIEDIKLQINGKFID
ncbi:MAG: transcriptional repressor [Saprospiraceae bacterium]